MDAIENSEYVTIGELVRLTGVRYSTLKFYTEDGLLDFEQEDENLTRRYKRAETLERILLIKKLKEDGMSIPQIKEHIIHTNAQRAAIFNWQAFAFLCGTILDEVIIIEKVHIIQMNGAAYETGIHRETDFWSASYFLLGFPQISSDFMWRIDHHEKKIGLFILVDMDIIMKYT